MPSLIEELQLDVLDLLIEEGGYWVGPDREVLLSLAQVVYNDESIDCHDKRYKRTSMAVLRLEEHGLISVDRRFEDVPQRANVLEGIRLL